MTSSGMPASWSLLARGSGSAALLRGLVLTTPLLALVCTHLAAHRTVPVLDVAIVALVLVCAVLPDSHTGTVVVVLVGIEWWTTVDDRVTLWLLATSVALALFHASMAAASVAPPSARWTRAMFTRWWRRTVVVCGATSGVWVVVALIGDHRVGGSSLLLAAALVVLAFAALWARAGSVEGRPTA